MHETTSRYSAPLSLLQLSNEHPVGGEFRDAEAGPIMHLLIFKCPMLLGSHTTLFYGLYMELRHLGVRSALALLVQSSRSLHSPTSKHVRFLYLELCTLAQLNQLATPGCCRKIVFRAKAGLLLPASAGRYRYPSVL